jgi:tetratricopeptide (TPR) repeat protein/transcriptional regulator with XRE-family HTH domain
MLGMAAESTARFPEKPNGGTRRVRLAMRRKALGLTQEHLAALLHVERTTVARWERGETEPLPWLRPKLAKAMRVSSDHLAELLDGGGSSGSGGTASVPRQLPAAVADFTGRAAELATLTKILDTAADGGTTGTMVISAIAGTAGVGKTALALHWAHQAAGQFPDGQLYVNLCGFAPSGAPVTPAEAIRRFLVALGMPPERIPADAEAQAGLYRSLVAGKTMLIVLDNARDEEQVRPLLPASPGSLVMVTSRNSLAGLAATNGARLLSLDVLTHDEAVQLLTARIGQARAAAEPDAIAEIADLCACLPLALAVGAARATVWPRLPLSALAGELRTAIGRLDALDTGDPAASVRAVFSWSYDRLSGETARMFRLLGLHCGPDISVPATASLAARSQPEARRLLRELTRDRLITEHVPGRYAFHDLLRAYAADLARQTDSVDDRAVASARFLDHYLHTAYAANMVMAPSHAPITVTALSPGAVPEPIADHQQAMTWFEAEHDVLSAAVSRAAESGFDRHAWQLPWAMAVYHQRGGHAHERVAMLGTGLAAATRLGDTAGQAVSHRMLAIAYIRLGDFGQAESHARQAMELCQGLGDRHGEARGHTTLGSIAERQGRYADALHHCEQALHLYQAAGYAAGEAQMLNNIGWDYGLLGDYQQARAFCRRAVILSAQVGDRHTEGYAWDSVGYAERHVGDFGEAAACYQRALSIFRDIGDRYSEANTLHQLGDTWQAAGDPPRAREAWQQAIAILEDLGDSNDDDLRAKLAEIRG